LKLLINLVILPIPYYRIVIWTTRRELPYTGIRLINDHIINSVKGTIIDPAKAKRMLDRQFGIDKMKDTSLGRIYMKGGFWGDRGCIEQSNVFFLPKGMELVILANSPFCMPNSGFMDNVLDVIEKSIESIFSTKLTIAAISVLAGFALIKKSRTHKVTQ